METLETRLRSRINTSLYALLFLTGLLGLSVLLEGCSDRCEVTNEMLYYKPVYTPLHEIRSSVAVGEPEELVNPGKIYLIGPYLFINEPGKGIHVIDNQVQTSPKKIKFINIPGNYDFAIKGNILYADSYIDLVALDITSIENIREVNRLENIFSSYNTLGVYVDPELGVITAWQEEKDVKVFESDCDAAIQPWGGMLYGDGIAVLAESNFKSSAAIAPGTGSGPGVGGSLARFTINNNHLYTLSGGDVQSIDLTDPTSPNVVSKTTITWDMETIFPYKNNLFIGSRTGMHILDVTNPASPQMISTYSHVRVCDPVVVQDDLAYVTLRSGTTCDGFTNQLEVINIEDLRFPQLVKSYPLTNPHGLGIDEETLFICDGNDGLKVYDASDINEIDKNQLAHYTGINARDVIPFNNTLVMMGEDGIFQYDYSNPKDIKFLSKIEISDAPED
jgi:hypothetical protein